MGTVVYTQAWRLDIVMETGHRNVGRLDIVRKPDAEMGTVAYTLAWRTKTARRMDTTIQTV